MGGLDFDETSFQTHSSQQRIQLFRFKAKQLFFSCMCHEVTNLFFRMPQGKKFQNHWFTPYKHKITIEQLRYYPYEDDSFSCKFLNVENCGRWTPAHELWTLVHSSAIESNATDVPVSNNLSLKKIRKFHQWIALTNLEFFYACSFKAHITNFEI